ncbi:MAG: hypothetical protein RIG61_11690 [Deltaproteobacteria bacterium]
MPKLPQYLIRSALVLVFAILPALPLSSAFAADEGGDLPIAPLDPDISDICTPSDCSPATPCPEPDESCYSVNGAFYCCIMPPVGGMPAVGE